jgi:general nucleoside transport system permease protein
VTRRTAVARALSSTSFALLIATAAALAVGGLLIIAVGVSPTDAYRTIWTGSAGSRDALAQTSLRIAPLLVMAIGLIPALRAGIFTIGSEGQFGIGALAAGLTAVGVAPHLPAWIAITAAALAGVGGGVAWAFIPALLRAGMGVDEILTTFAFNFIATFLLLWLLNGPARGEGSFLVQSTPMPESTWLPTFGGSVANIALLILPALVAAMVVFSRTPVGYRVRLLGARRSLAVAAGAHPRRVDFTTILIAGAAAGLAGWIQVAGVDRAVFATVFRGYGYLALALVALGEAKVLPTVVGAVLFAALQNGSEAMQLGLGVSADFVFVMQGLVLFLMAFRVTRSST